MSKYDIPLFNTEDLLKEVNLLDVFHVEARVNVIKKWSNNDYIKSQSEIQLGGEFFKDIFVDVLDYSTVTSGEKDWSLCIEQKTEVDGTKPDGVLGLYSASNTMGKTQAVIELKGPNIDLDEKQKRNAKDYGTPVEQAFSYASKYDGCKWVLVSNFKEIRIYKVGRSQNYYEKFLLEDIQEQNEFKRFYLLLCRNNLITKENESKTEMLSKRAYNIEKNITKEFYSKYKLLRLSLLHVIKDNNPYLDIDQCIRCSQKFLDRIVFICFCQGMKLIKQDELKNALVRGKYSYNGIWIEIKGLFRALDEGKKTLNINKFNGELFKFDTFLDNSKIPDEFFENLNDIINYKFSNDINVEILGHIFEQSITDLAELKKEFTGIEDYDNEGRRNKEGIFYTPNNVTKLIVDETLGKYLEKKFNEIVNYYNSQEIKVLKDIEGKKLNKTNSKELFIYVAYRDILRDLKILDASCGSGAFLVQVCDFLSKEYERVERKMDYLKNNHYGQINLFQLNQEILSKNIYGVDLNEESVEITKLSLWLKTVEKDRPLLALNRHIRCGNSLINDSPITSKAFDWNKEFPEVLETGGFDIIIGNPPYLKWSLINPRKPFETGQYLGISYNCRIHHEDAQPNLYIFFIILCMNLLKDKGSLGFITSQEWLNYEKLNTVKKSLLENGTINNIIFNSKYSVFIDLDGTTIGTNSSIIIYEKGIFEESTSINIPLNEEEMYFNTGNCSSIPYKITLNEKWNRYGITSEIDLIMHQISGIESISLDNRDYFDVFGGFQPPINKLQYFTLTESEYLMVPKSEREIVYKAILNADSIDKYFMKNEGVFWIVANELTSESDFNNTYPYLYRLLKSRIKSINDSTWYKFPNIRNLDKFKSMELKLLAPRTKKYNAFSLDESKHLFKGTNSAIYVKKGFDVKFVMGILNATLLTFWYKFEGDAYHGETRKYEPKSVKKFKIPVVEKNIQNNIANKVQNILNNGISINYLIIEFKEWLQFNFKVNIENNFYKLETHIFIKKYFKQNSKLLSPKDLNIINNYFNKYSEGCRDFLNNNRLLIQEIDEIVYNIYGIDENQKKIIREL
ncbi:N-6 DNA methylase [Clostridium algoriphilum]|uniref:Eco57I restriction-modification methylase domain-containing protein n=1 Tax=Clostridium algoriphilum TaxID=198347 RepID=UPI001CF24EF3|nr:N-6 DNA methylase [Clostridium algoriphilum]MCB2292177.1 N-6 DNA methylase [Clostridium algoriphilum]